MPIGVLTLAKSSETKKILPSPCQFAILNLMQKINVLLLTNYRSDHQYSMLRFGKLLTDNIQQNEINIHEIFPKNYLNKFTTNHRLKKMAGYIDKYIIFPSSLSKICQSLISKTDIVHIIDHSNAIYLPKIKNVFKKSNLVTCHDLIAVRTALGEFKEAPPTSTSGRFLQNRILNCLSKASFYACDSKSTMSDLNNMVKKSIGQSEVIHLGTKPSKNNIINKIYSQNQALVLSNKKYLLHVGSAAWYKNRESILKAFKSMRENFGHSDLHLVLVGPTPQIHETTEELRFWIHVNSHYIHTVEKISEVDLEALYINARMLLFPSHIEGFGWPPLEAASQGIPVITTKTGAIADILGENAIYINSNDQDALEKSVERTLISQPNQSTRLSIPTTEECILKYSDLYKKIMLNKNH